MLAFIGRTHDKAAHGLLKARKRAHQKTFGPFFKLLTRLLFGIVLRSMVSFPDAALKVFTRSIIHVPLVVDAGLAPV